jgi:predicted membrane protein
MLVAETQTSDKKETTMNSATKVSLIIVFVLLMVGGCVNGFSRQFTRAGELRTESHTVEREGAERVDVRIRPGIQELNLSGGGSELFTGEFTYNVDELEPEIDYQVRNGVGDLEVGIRRNNINFPMGNIINRWDLQLGEEIPMDLELALGLGDSNIDLSNVTLTDLDIQSGAGKVNVIVGSQEMERARVRAGLGDTNLSFAGGSINDLEFEAGAGTVAIDLAGNWQNDLDATISGGLGSIDLTVPSNVGVRIEVNRGLGGVDANGFRVDDNIYTNDAYGESEITLDITINQGAGEIEIRMAE